MNDGGGGEGGVVATKSELAGLSKLCVAPAVRPTRSNVLLKAFSPLPATSFTLLLFYQSAFQPFFTSCRSPSRHSSSPSPALLHNSRHKFSTLYSRFVIHLFRLIPRQSRFRSSLHLPVDCCHNGCIPVRPEALIGNQMEQFSALQISWVYHCRPQLLANPGSAILIALS